MFVFSLKSLVTLSFICLIFSKAKPLLVIIKSKHVFSRKNRPLYPHLKFFLLPTPYTWISEERERRKQMQLEKRTVEQY